MVGLLEPVLLGQVVESLSKGQMDKRTLLFWGGLGIGNVLVSVYLAVMADRLAHRLRLQVMGQVVGSMGKAQAGRAGMLLLAANMLTASTHQP